MQAYLSAMPSGTRESFQPCPEALWLSLCRDDKTCTFYQTPDWLHVAADYLRSKGGLDQSVEVAPLWLETGEGPVVMALLRRRRFGVWHYFAPFGTYSAPLFHGVLTQAGKNQIRSALSRLNVLLPSSPFTPNAVQVGRPLPYVIQAVSLANVDPANPMRDWDEGQQRRVRVSRRTGVTVRRATQESDWRRYYALYQESLERWGDAATSVYDYALFDALRRGIDDDERMALWLAEVPRSAFEGGESRPPESENQESIISAGYLTFYHNRHVVPWHGSASKSAFRFGVSQALFHHMIADATRRGFAYFDLTGSSGLQNLVEFKSRFGTQEMPFEGSLNRVGLYGLLAQCKSAVTAIRHSLGPKAEPKLESKTGPMAESKAGP